MEHNEEQYEKRKAAKIMIAGIDALETISSNTRCDIQGGYEMSAKLGKDLQSMRALLEKYIY